MVSVLGDTNVVVFEVAYRSTTPCAAFIYQKESTERPNSHEVTKSPLATSKQRAASCVSAVSVKRQASAVRVVYYR